LGSVEVFPRKRGTRGSDQEWRGTPIPGSGAINVRGTRLEDYAAIRALQRQSTPFMEPWTLKQLESQLIAFPEGQMVAAGDGQVVGFASSLVVQWDDYGVEHTWKSITGDGFFTTHDPRGRTLYGADLTADTSRRGYAIGRALFQARRRLCRGRNLRRIIATARLAGYRASREAMSPELYAMRVIWGDIPDPSMRFQMSQGFQFCGILGAYLPQDAESCGYAALLAWLNPLYSPSGPSAYAAPARQSRCA
jgi:GNAT superfamily N-acetyltransferase